MTNHQNDRQAPPQAAPGNQPALHRVLNLPLLLFYGVGVTVGAGIFALVGKLIGVAGDTTPIVFLAAALLAGVSAGSYALLASRIPKAGGAAVYAEAAFGRTIARITGLVAASTGILSGGVIALAFGSYLGTLLPLSPTLLAALLIAVLALIACLGVRESVLIAAAVTAIEVGALLVVIGAGIPGLADPDLWGRIASAPFEGAGLGLVLAGIPLAFYAFIGFEDIVNLAEETKRPERVMAPAVVLTLAVTTVIYVLVAAVALSVDDRFDLATSDAPVADLFAVLTGGSPAAIATVAAIAMINGILVQILMASRVLYGMASSGILSLPWLAVVSPRRKTPVRATILVAGIMIGLVLLVPIVGLAEATSYITLGLFIVVNLSLWQILRKSGDRHRTLKAAWGLGGAIVTAAVLVMDLVRRIAGPI